MVNAPKKKTYNEEDMDAELGLDDLNSKYKKMGAKANNPVSVISQ